MESIVKLCVRCHKLFNIDNREVTVNTVCVFIFTMFQQFSRYIHGHCICISIIHTITKQYYHMHIYNIYNQKRKTCTYVGLWKSYMFNFGLYI